MHLEERVEMLEKKVRELENNKSINFVKPPEIGDRFEFRGIKFTCLDKVKGGYLVIADFLDEKVFAGNAGIEVSPTAEDVEGFNAYIENYKANLPVEEAAVKSKR